MDLREFLAAPYHRVVEQDEDGSWSATIEELDGVFSGGESSAEAMANLEEAMALWFEVESDAGRSIPEPWGSSTYSGVLRFRLPKSLHRSAALRAKIEGVSLNQFLVTAVGHYVTEGGSHLSPGKPASDEGPATRRLRSTG